MDPSENAPEPANLRFLRRLVTVLTAVMIGGLVIVIALLVTRLTADGPLPLPDSIALPAGTQATAFTRGSDWNAVVTADDQILILDAKTGALIQTIQIARSAQ